MNYLFLCMSLLMSVAYIPMLASTFERVDKRQRNHEKTRLKQQREREEIFKNQTPHQQDFYLEFMSGWQKYLAEDHPDYEHYLDTMKAQIADNYAQRVEYQLQVQFLQEQQLVIVNQIKKLELEIMGIEFTNKEIQRLERERLSRKKPIAEL